MCKCKCKCKHSHSNCYKKHDDHRHEDPCKEKSFITKKINGLRAISGILLEATIPITVLKVSAAAVRSVAEEDTASHFST